LTIPLPIDAGGGGHRTLGDRALTLWTTGLLLAGGLPQYLVASLAVSMREDFPYSDAQLGVAAGVSFAISAVVSVGSGKLVGRIGVAAAVSLAVGLVAAASLGMAVFADSAAAIIGLMVVHGLGSGIGSPTFARLIAGGVRAEKQGTAFGLLTSAPQLSAFAAGLALPLIAHPLSWRAAFVLPGAVGAVCLLGLFRGGHLSAQAVRSESAPRRIRGLRSIHLIGVAAALASGAVIGMRSFLVVFAVAEGFDQGAAGLLLSALGLTAIGSRVGLGLLGDRRPGDALLRAASLMTLCAAGFVLMAIGGHGLIIAGALLAGGLGWGWQAPLSLAVVSRYPHATGAAIGIQMSGFYTGALVGPLMIGFLAEHGSYSTAWVLCCGLALAAGAVALLVRRLPAD
jgi:MFS family permease